MAVPTIPTSISLSQIQTEFGGSNPISISEYYAGAGYVGSGTANATSVAIPTSGTISFANFSGASAIQTYYSGTITGYLYYQNYYSGYFMTSTETFYGWFNNNGTAPSPSTLTTGKTIKSWYNYFYTDYNNNSNDYSRSVLEISGFSSDPGSSYIYSCKLGNSTLVYSSSANYNYFGGVASWYWPAVNTLNGAVFTIGQSGTYTGYIYK